jgi:hypothetical protein
VFAAFDARAGTTSSGSARVSSDHLAGELAGGLSVRQLLDRSGVLASANDLLGATAVVLPELVSFRRALTRLLGRPVGQSGSGPTCWVLYGELGEAREAAALVNAAADDGRLPTLGADHPFVAASTIDAGPSAQTSAQLPQPVSLDRRSSS